MGHGHRDALGLDAETHTLLHVFGEPLGLIRPFTHVLPRTSGGGRGDGGREGEREREDEKGRERELKDVFSITCC